MKNTFVCKICGEPNNTDLYTVKEMMFGFRDEFLYFQCSNCECLQIIEFPENISKYYPANYYSLEDKKKIEIIFIGIKGTKKKLSIMVPYFPMDSKTKLLGKFYQPENTKSLKILP